MSSKDSNNKASNSPTCASPGCSNPGKLKCSACSSVYYCTAECQKKHWTVHKTTCKKDSAPSSPVREDNEPSEQNVINPREAPFSPADQELLKEIGPKLQAAKQEIQKCLLKSDFDGAEAGASKALNIMKKLPGPAATAETIQLHLTLSSAYIQFGRVNEAEKHANIAVQTAEAAAASHPGVPQLIDLLSIALGNRAIANTNLGKLDLALKDAKNSLGLSEQIFAKTDPRLHKSLRNLAVVLEKRGETAESERLFLRAYTIISVSIGPQAPEAQMILDEMVNMLKRKGDLDSAEKYARNNFKAISDKKLEEKEVLIVADSASRLGAILVQKGNFSEAEPLIEKALNIRESSKLSSMNPLGLAYSLSQLAGIRENLGNVSEDTEALLVRAMEIFSKIKGPQSMELNNVMAQIRSVKTKRMAKSSGVTVEDADSDDGLEYSVKEGKPKDSAKSASSAAKPDVGGIITANDRNVMKFAHGDIQGRLMQANVFFELGKYVAAEVLLQESFDIAINKEGPEHPITKAARQNLAVVRNNRLNQLWDQVALEETKALEEAKKADGADGVEASNNNETSKSKGSKDKESELTLEEKLVLDALIAEDSKPAKGGCLIC